MFTGIFPQPTVYNASGIHKHQRVFFGEWNPPWLNMPNIFNRRKHSCTKLLVQEVITVMAVPGTTFDGKEAVAISILERAAELDNQRRFTEATECYEEGLQLLIDVIKATKGEPKRNILREKALQYMDKAEKTKESCKHQQQELPQSPTIVVTSGVNEVPNYFQPSDSRTSTIATSSHRVEHNELARHRVIHIASDSTGNSYAKLFGDYLDHQIITVTVKDPYVRSIHQIYNFLRFCELVVKSCRNLRFIKLVTTNDADNSASNNQQMYQLDEIGKSLSDRNVELELQISPTLHDREIRLSSGWIIKIGRGLDFYKPPRSKFSLGYCDFDLRSCHETTIDIYRSDTVI